LTTAVNHPIKINCRFVIFKYGSNICSSCC